mgnify:CR=1 FL=1
MAYEKIDPCFCISICSSKSSPCPPKAEKCSCLNICDGTVPSDPDNPLKPCGDSKSVDFSTLILDSCVCEGEISYSVESYDSTMFANPEITGTELSFITVGDQPNRYSDIVIEACCKGKDGVTRTVYFCITPYIEDICKCVNCDETCEKCDPCTGLCIPKPGAIIVGETQNTSGQIIVK